MEQNVNKQFINWDNYYDLVIRLAKNIKEDFENNHDHEHQFYDQILCLARGGTPLGDALSRIFDLPLAILFTSSYKLLDKQEGIYIDDQIAKQNNTLGKNILLVDDLVDSGETLHAVAQFMQKHHQCNGKQMKITTAVIWKKDSSMFVPDYYVKETTKNDWIVQPFEWLDNFKL